MIAQSIPDNTGNSTSFSSVLQISQRWLQGVACEVEICIDGQSLNP